MANNIKETFSAAINDIPCDHQHKDFESAEKCVRATIRRARRGEKFYGSDFAAKLNPKDDADVAMYVRRNLIAK